MLLLDMICPRKVIKYYPYFLFFFFLNNPPPPKSSPLPLPDALPFSRCPPPPPARRACVPGRARPPPLRGPAPPPLHTPRAAEAWPQWPDPRTGGEWPDPGRVPA